uniref:Sushi domain-containing protein n=1 Tax=Ciona savignyi TaxID=51511 RepID=H2Z983_CIOSA
MVLLPGRTLPCRVCSPPEQPINGMVRSDREFTYGDIATYQCDFGYKPLENKPVQRRCNENGTWGETPICEVIYDCDFEEEATPTCGYENMGWFRRTVTDNGTVSFITGIAAFRDAVLVSQAYNGSGGCLSFNYRQSNNMVQAKSLQLVIMPALERSPKTILWQSGTEPTDWTNQEVTIPASSSEVRWSFIYSGSSFSLLDDILFDKSKVCDIEVVDPTSTLAVVETTPAPGAAASFSVSAFLTSLCLICCYYIAL